VFNIFDQAGDLPFVCLRRQPQAAMFVWLQACTSLSDERGSQESFRRSAKNPRGGNMREVTDLQTRIRIKAEYELRQEVEGAKRTMSNLIAEASYPEMKFNGESFQAHRLLDMIAEKLIEQLMPSREDRAIKDFIEHVESLQAQIDELKADPASSIEDRG
jgi:hypothetical protein